jgi:hypothetical protein
MVQWEMMVDKQGCRLVQGQLGLGSEQEYDCQPSERGVGWLQLPSWALYCLLLLAFG